MGVMIPGANFLPNTDRRALKYVLKALTRYFDLPKDKRRDAAAFIIKGEMSCGESAVSRDERKDHRGRRNSSSNGPGF